MNNKKNFPTQALFKDLVHYCSVCQKEEKKAENNNKLKKNMVTNDHLSLAGRHDNPPSLGDVTTK